MSMDPVAQSIIGTAVGELFIVTRIVMNIIISTKSSSKELREKLLGLKPTIDEISRLSSDLNPSSHKGQPFKDFQAQLQDGLHLVKKLERVSSFNLYRRYRYGKQVLKVEKNINDFLVTQALAGLVLDVEKLNVDSKGCNERLERIEEMGQHIIDSVNAKMTNDASSNSIMLHQMSTTQLFGTSIDESHDTIMTEQSTSSSDSQVPDMPNFVVGLNNLVNDVKQILIYQKGVNIVGIKGMGGSGKTTLALAVCSDSQVKDFFHNNIIFITVAQSPNVKGLLETMWDKIIGGGTRPFFQSIEDAHNQLQKKLSLKGYRPTLVVLDDVWSKSNVEDLLFEAEGYKTIITTRQDYTIPISNSTRVYNIPMLQKTDALALFCFWAFGRPSIPTTEDEDIVKMVEAECKGLPLALKVIGSSLRGEPQLVWENANKKLRRAESISEYHRDNLLHCLETSVDVLDDESKQCFLDLGAFPKGRKFSVDSLLDIWVYVRGMEWQDAFVVLLELASRNLLNLTSDPGSRAISFGCASELSFSQHDVMRDLALRLANHDSSIHCKRLFMPSKDDSIPREWLTLKDQTSKAQFVSIHTGQMEEQNWCQINFPEVEALALFFAASQYCLPTFLHTMPKLKVVIIYNYSSKRARLHWLPSFPSFTQMKSVLVERLIVSPLSEYCRFSGSLEKLSVCLCEGLGNMTLLDKEEQVPKFPMFLEINFDHCSDLEELPGKICDLTCLQKLSVTNCHLIQKLPDDLGRLRSLRVLRLSACPSLSMLPPSLSKLQQLEFLDISLCRSLKDLPMEFDQLSKLKMLDMRECSGLKKLPKALAKLKSLRRVICDESTGRQWQAIKASVMPNLTVEVVEERFNLDWLDD